MLFSVIHNYICTINEITDKTVVLEYCTNIDSLDSDLEFESIEINNNILKHIYLDENVINYQSGNHLYIVVTMTVIETNGLLQYKFEKTEDIKAKEYMDKLNVFIDKLFSGPEWEEIQKNVCKPAID